MSEQITAVIQTLRSLFKDKGELRGLKDWDSLVGCIMILEHLVKQLEQDGQETEETEGGMTDGR